MTAPARLWLKIGEAASRLRVSPKELRYWESVIPEIRPRRSRGNLRYYHLEELPRLERIRDWLAEGLTVADCRQLLRTGELKRGLGLEPPPAAAPAPPVAAPRLVQARQALTALLARLQAEPPAPPRKRRRPPVKAKPAPEAVAEAGTEAGTEPVAEPVTVGVAVTEPVAEPAAAPGPKPERPPRKSRAKATPAGEADGFGPLFDGI